MPAMHLMSVDLPAPLSPTRAITSPARTSKSTSVSAWTEPKRFDIPRISSTGASRRSLWCFVAAIVEGRSEGAPGAPPIRSVLLADLRVGADADLALLQELVREEQLVVRLRDRGRRDENGLLVLLAILDRAGRLAALPLSEGDRGWQPQRLPSGWPCRRSCVCQPERMFWTPCGSRVLAAQRDRLELLGLERRDDRVARGRRWPRRPRRSCCRS